ncbi:MAG: AAA family ATPase [Candidatus Nanopelagicales bacterium]
MTAEQDEGDWNAVKEDEPPGESSPDPDRRTVELTSAASIKPRRVLWLWLERMALGALSLVAGPEGLGKSTLVYWLVAFVTRGLLPGEHFGTPKSVLIAATEDSWAHTVVPRLMAAGADLEKVYRVDVTTSSGTDGALSLPADIPAMGKAVQEVDASLLVLDPLTSRLSANLDTHKDSETRLALEPLVAFADRYNVAVVGIMHFNKSGSTDPLSLVMASKAFTAVARSVSTVIKDPDDETEAARLFGTVKNNLGRSDLATLRFTIAGHRIDTADGDAWTGKLVWGTDAVGTIGDALTRAADSGNQSAAAEAADWLEGYLDDADGCAASKDIKFASRAEGHSDNSLRAARKRVGIRVVNTKEKPRRTLWALSGHECQSCLSPSRGDHTTNTTNTTRNQERSRVSRVSRAGTVERQTRLDDAPNRAATSATPLQDPGSQSEQSEQAELQLVTDISGEAFTTRRSS